jgi:Predicted transcriptional regulators
MLDSTIYKKIKDRRTLLGITQQDLSDISGVALRTIKQIETGNGNPSISTLTKIAGVLGLSIELVIKNPDNI